MAYPIKPTGSDSLRDYDFAINDASKIPMDEYLFKNGYKNADESEVESVPDAHEQNWLFDILHKNLRYAIGMTEENKKVLDTKIATPTSIGQVKIGYGLEVTSNGVLSVSKSVAEDANIISYDLPVGSYMLWSGINTPEYFIEPAGQSLLRSSYPELWRFAQDNNLVGKLFGEGDGSTTFTVTDIRGSFISIANNNDKVGRYTEAGLPNISGSLTGSAWGYETNQGVASGSFKDSVRGTSYGLQGGWDNTATYARSTIDFKASNSNSIYGKSTTVTPANWGLKLILKALPTPPSNAVPTGTVLNYTSASVPDGYIIANGAELSRTTFSNLFRWAFSNNLIKPQNSIPSTAHAFYGDGDGNTTFTIPDLRGVILKNADLGSERGGADLGVYQPDGLPNITGTIAGLSYDNTNSKTEMAGAFYWGTEKSNQAGKGTDDRLGYFDASRMRNSSNVQIYGISEWVQPKNVSITPLIKY